VDEEFAESEKGMRAGVQATAALALAVVAVGGMWALGVFSPKSTVGRPAVCSSTDDVLPRPYASGAKLCAALNRPDLPALLGTPTEYVQSADGTGDWTTVGGAKIPTPQAEVSLKSYSVKVSVDYGRLPVAGSVDALGTSAQPLTVLGHPAVLSSDRTVAISFSLGGGKASTGPGGVARCLLVAMGAKGDAGSFEIDVWRQDSALPDDAALLRVAEQVLPTLPGWTA
jgi:hypothetical protein